MGGKRISHITGRIELEGKRFHYATQNGVQFKIYELFISGIFYLILLDRGWLWVTEMAESETVDQEAYCIKEFVDKVKSIICIMVFIYG